MIPFLQFTVNGLTTGALFATVAVGLVLVRTVSGVLNLAQGSFLVGGALLFAALTNGLQVPAVLALLIAVIAGGIVGTIVDVGIVRPSARGGGIGAAGPVIATLAAAEVLAYTFRAIWGNNPLFGAPLVSGGPLQIGGVLIGRQALLLIVVISLLLGLLALVFSRTVIGKALRASEQNMTGAILVGISPATMRTYAFVLAGSIGALGGALFAGMTPISWDAGLLFAIKGFVAAVLGGWKYGRTLGAAVFIGLVESYTAGYISSEWKDAVTMSVLLAALILPTARHYRAAGPRFLRTRLLHPTRKES